ncbi:MAG: Lrp/AsnC family transcriptional regulator [Rhodospirillaceae bacterium]|jgi:Lrp/AsnC family transcriptional regulator, leucine-responsive regulatory protein|nr:Lrp/AsnC family transcriptional regulator [Rhodospirillaceae bacterium]MBT4589375.1 Lrp/AsnC family transcriptional regulator [Rhodospirillaceae bacterium]MBT4940937.1 Lrp/AsnC family transcriptional regulator [Rhodospirillaceae bacterium]MBT7265442.1 Lrp/AsnC family transcriptional regulator [Rhodospirillaceae bacterium]
MDSLNIDAIDSKIIAELQRNSDLSNLELAEKVGLSPSPCLRRVKMLQDAGIIKGKVTLIDAEKIGLNVSVFVQVTLEKQIEENLTAFEMEIDKCPEVVECYLMTGEADYLLRIVVTDLQAYEHFLKDRLTRFPGVLNIRSSFALNQVKYSTALPINHLS